MLKFTLLALTLSTMVLATPQVLESQESYVPIEKRCAGGGCNGGFGACNNFGTCGFGGCNNFRGCGGLGWGGLGCGGFGFNGLGCGGLGWGAFAPGVGVPGFGVGCI